MPRQHNAHKVYFVFQVSDAQAGTEVGRHSGHYSSNTYIVRDIVIHTVQSMRASHHQRGGRQHRTKSKGGYIYRHALATWWPLLTFRSEGSPRNNQAAGLWSLNYRVDDKKGEHFIATQVLLLCTGQMHAIKIKVTNQSSAIALIQKRIRATTRQIFFWFKFIILSRKFVYMDWWRQCLLERKNRQTGRGCRRCHANDIDSCCGLHPLSYLIIYMSKIYR